jgi:hypothetical protein
VRPVVAQYDPAGHAKQVGAALKHQWCQLGGEGRVVQVPGCLEVVAIDQQLAAGCRIGLHYPQPIVDHATAYREARLKIAVLRRESFARQEARKVFLRHGSRKRQSARKSHEQLNLPMD